MTWSSSILTTGAATGAATTGLSVVAERTHAVNIIGTQDASTTIEILLRVFMSSSLGFESTRQEIAMAVPRRLPSCFQGFDDRRRKPRAPIPIAIGDPELIQIRKPPGRNRRGRRASLGTRPIDPVAKRHPSRKDAKNAKSGSLNSLFLCGLRAFA
jgi:hypothetical protein